MPINETHMRAIKDLFVSVIADTKENLGNAADTWISEALSDSGDFNSLVEKLKKSDVNKDFWLPILRLRQLFLANPTTEVRVSQVSRDVIVNNNYGVPKNVPFNLESMGPITADEFRNCVKTLVIAYEGHDAELTELIEKKAKEIANLKKAFQEQYGELISITKLKEIIPTLEQSVNEVEKVRAAGVISGRYLRYKLKQTAKAIFAEHRQVSLDKQAIYKARLPLEEQGEYVAQELASLDKASQAESAERAVLESTNKKLQAQLHKMVDEKAFESIPMTAKTAKCNERSYRIAGKKLEGIERRQKELAANQAAVIKNLEVLNSKNKAALEKEELMRQRIERDENRIKKIGVYAKEVGAEVSDHRARLERARSDLRKLLTRQGLHAVEAESSTSDRPQRKYKFEDIFKGSPALIEVLKKAKINFFYDGYNHHYLDIHPDLMRLVNDGHIDYSGRNLADQLRGFLRNKPAGVKDVVFKGAVDLRQITIDFPAYGKDPLINYYMDWIKYACEYACGKGAKPRGYNDFYKVVAVSSPSHASPAISQVLERGGAGAGWVDMIEGKEEKKERAQKST